MSMLDPAPPCVAFQTTASASDQAIRKQVGRIFQQHRAGCTKTDTRRDRREPFPYPVHITPVRADGSPEIEETFVVLGKHLSERGLDFYYQAPVPYRRVIASWEGVDGQWLGLLLDLRWCRSNKHGWYENGGRFLQAVPSPLNDVDLFMPVDHSQRA
jgi:hypothetical protein